ncbi:DUF7344 domain-containing protein [Halalkalicoccus salilacus]|uniref:DUF7344 domain-containing protein n=1 Tax=Halalkalicoccus salilacus TaxID=3117459 RepID=UPI00300EA440
MSNHLPEPNLSEFDVGGDQQDELFDILSHSHRRFVLQYLQTADTPLPVNDLAAELVAWKNQLFSADQLVEGNAALVEISLVHSHLPKMAETGFIRYDRTRQTVTLGDRTEEVRAHLQAMRID